VFFQGGEEDDPVLRFALGHPVLAAMIAGRCAAEAGLGRDKARVHWIVPEHWTMDAAATATVEICRDWPQRPSQSGSSAEQGWTALSNGQFCTHINPQLVRQVREATSASVVALCASRGLQGYHERTLLSGDASVVGFRRFYEDSVEPVPMPRAWPHRLLIRTADVGRAFQGGMGSGDFQTWVDRWRAMGLTCAAFEVAGAAHDLSTGTGLWDFFMEQADRHSSAPAGWTLVDGRKDSRGPTALGCRAGKVWLGPEATLGSGVTIIGPSIVSDRAVLEDESVVASSILGPGVVVGPGRHVWNSLVTETGRARAAGHPRVSGSASEPEDNGFRTWPRFSYARGPKRVMDIVVATAVLVLFAPVFPVIALAIKLNCPGPVFFKHRREGRHGKPFHCVKFRSMRTGADQIQEKLRTVSEVDGPQFKMADDPRITRVGHFLRETYLDEIPQFLNVLAGDMSVIGPRPSPKAENTLCPYWRYARLSVRPGVTGLWQVHRTRQPMKDFQEWIYYDTEYVERLSFRMDVRICLQTFVKMLGRLVEQFERG
jgi:lipopolysaccharide/colanic/teichoic acid biosynthesis glycosyltransferase